MGLSAAVFPRQEGVAHGKAAARKPWGRSPNRSRTTTRCYQRGRPGPDHCTHPPDRPVSDGL